MRISEHTARRFTARNVAYAGFGFASLIMPAAGLMAAGGAEGIFGLWLFLSSPVLGLLGVILNIRGLARIREGQAGDYDLILTWPGFFAAAFSCLSSMLVLSMLAAP